MSLRTDELKNRIEARKHELLAKLSELKADAHGRVRTIHADNGQAVEFGTLLFELEPIVAPPVV